MSTHEQISKILLKGRKASYRTVSLSCHFKKKIKRTNANKIICFVGEPKDICNYIERNLDDAHYTNSSGWSWEWDAQHVLRMLFQEDSNRCCATTGLATNVPTVVSVCCFLRSKTFTADNFRAHEIPKTLRTVSSKPVRAGSNKSPALALPFFLTCIVSNYFSNLKKYISELFWNFSRSRNFLSCIKTSKFHKVFLMSIKISVSATAVLGLLDDRHSLYLSDNNIGELKK